jgi:abortive phage resistance protein AbiGi (putative antitoxin)
MPTQRYVSRELTHFVGKGLSEDQQYSLLVNDILKAGWLMHPPVDGRQPGEVLKGRPLVGGTRVPDVDSTEARYSEVVCFCDIPVTDLEIHMTKYSRFGLSFLKPYLVGKGANPVLYVANSSPALPFGLPGTQSGNEVWPRSKVFEGNLELFEDYRHKLDWPPRFFLDMLVFSFIKYFDDSTSDEDEANVYMEREWRVLGDVNFALADVHRVFMPERYAGRFRADLPNYTGQLTFSDNI